MSLNYSFKGKSILITEGGQGMGRQLVQKFYDDGATVYTVDKNPETIQKLRDELPSVTAEVIDLSDWDATRKVVESFGVIDHLVNSAGIIILQDFMGITKEAASLQYDVNVNAVINVTQVVTKHLIKEGREGSIVNISSVAARFGCPTGIGSCMYSASKAALENLTKSMAIELGAHNIRVNCILPGTTNTPMLQNSQSKPEIDDYIKQMLNARMIVKRLIEPNEITDLVVFLLSPLSSMIVGEAVVIDGGFLTG